ncbi:hypothetical protein KC19_VG004200 [Ceratodon purpureus]|uniref:Uncharacterized protein n=1 Tax=Ceratodon purpureus TaxID=3225 RepID=A0A8T0HKK9_CERPU|nr:hypothetical protein KC19_VG004200 [Ceratodon purpureus]
MMIVIVVMKVLVAFYVLKCMLPITMTAALYVIAASALLFANCVAKFRGVVAFEDNSAEDATETAPVGYEEVGPQGDSEHATDHSATDFFSSLPNNIVVMCIWPKVVASNRNFGETCRMIANARLVFRAW